MKVFGDVLSEVKKNQKVNKSNFMVFLKVYFTASIKNVSLKNTVKCQGVVTENFLENIKYSFFCGLLQKCLNRINYVYLTKKLTHNNFNQPCDNSGILNTLFL